MLLASCSLTPAHQRPQDTAPERWKNAAPGPAYLSAPISADWWRKFGSAELDRIMTEALNNNLDLEAAKQRIGQYRALAKIAGAPLWPALSATGSFNYSDSNRQTGGGAGQGFWTLAYEADLWGGLRAGRDSARAHYDNARNTFDALRLVMMGDVAHSYFTCVGLKERRRIAAAYLHNADQVLGIIGLRFEAGAVSALDVAQQQTERANAEAALAQLDQQIAQTENALAVLLGRSPQRFKVNGDNLHAVQLPQPGLAQPARLFEQRPDVQGAESELIAAGADIGKARAAFYPRLQLNAENVFSAAAMSQPAGIAIMLASSLSAPIFQGGRLEGELERTEARQKELIASYRQTLLNAYREVEDALALGNQSMRRQEALKSSVASAESAYALAYDRYLAGATDFQTLLNAQRSLLTSQDSEVRAQTDVLNASVLLFKALGGGWRRD